MADGEGLKPEAKCRVCNKVVTWRHIEAAQDLWQADECAHIMNNDDHQRAIEEHWGDIND